MWDLFRALDRGWSIEQIHEADENRSVVPAAVRRDSRHAQRDQPTTGLDGLDADRDAAAEARRLRRRRDRAGARRRTRARFASAGASQKAEAGLQARRHLRRRVRVVHAVSVQLVRADVRVEPERPRQGRHPRQRAQPHRPGHRVRLLLLSRRVRAARGRPRDGDDQLQPGNGVDRLRHRRPAVLPAADVRGRDGGDRDRAIGGRRRVVPGAVRRPDAAEAGAGAAGGGRQDSRHVARFDRSRRGSQALRGAAVGAGHHAAGERHRHVARGSARGRRRASASRSSCGRRTCSAAAAWRSSTTSARSIAT